MSEYYGLGDAVAAFTKVTGVKKIVEKVSEITGIDCKCDLRQEKMNYIPLPIKKKNGTREDS